jgi:hypothetical protein
MNLVSIIAILCIILALPFCIFLGEILIGSPDNIIHQKQKKEDKELLEKELLEIFKKEKGL